MAEQTLNIQNELEKAVTAKKIKVGLKSVMRALKQGTAHLVVFSKNTPKEIQEEIEKNAQLANIKAVQFDGISKELGVRCRRTHSVMSAVILKA